MAHRSHLKSITAVGLALTGSLSLFGCLNAPTTAASQPAQARAADTSPPAATAPAPQAPAPAPDGAAPPAVIAADPEPLPANSIDSDLEPEDNVAVETLFDSDELRAYLPSDLIHDGGVILFRTLALTGVESEDMDAEAKDSIRRSKRAEGCVGPLDPPDMWKRQEFVAGGRGLKLRRIPGQPGMARAEVKTINRGTLVYKDADSGRAVRKKYNEIFHRTMLFQRDASRWSLAEVSPIVIESQGGRSGLEIRQVGLFKGTETTPTLTLTEKDPSKSIRTGVPTFTPGESAKIVVDVENRNACGLFVFTHVVGDADRSRLQLSDDGLNGDEVAGDGRYTGTFFVPTAPGLRHFAIDVIDPVSFTTGGVYRSNGLGMSLIVKSQP